jgi:hypothetical protein
MYKMKKIIILLTTKQIENKKVYYICYTQKKITLLYL